MDAPLAAIGACVLLTACAPPSGSASAERNQAAAAQDSAQDEQAAPDSMANMVSAVDPTGSGKPISLKFRLEARPVVGTPVKIMVALIPDADAQINHIHGSFLAGDGLLLQSDRSFDLSDVRAGTAVFREVTVVPQQTGVLSLNATLLMDSDKSSETRTYSIPLIASDNSST
jgi:hypothetical protein